MKKILFILLIVLCWGCTNSSSTEKHQKRRSHVINVHDKIKEIVIEDVLLNSRSIVCMAGECLLIYDFKTSEEIIHLFDKNNYEYIISTAPKGQGPGEIANIGFVSTDEDNRCFYVPDIGKNIVFRYSLDSVLANSSYTPDMMLRMNEKYYPSHNIFLNDTFSVAVKIEPTGISDFKAITSRWNMKTGELVPMKYEHPEIEKKRVTLAASLEHGIYVEFYSHHDLITICTLDGELKYNIYGPRWDNKTSNSVYHYMGGHICGDKIVALYLGKNRKDLQASPTEILVFDLKGDYLATLESGCKISNFCYDKENNRLIFSMNDDMQFGYLDLDGLV